MQVTETSAEGLKREFKVVISARDLDEKLDLRLREIGRSIRVPGFRPGKVPAAVLKQRFGQTVIGEIVEESVSDSANQAIMERGMRPALQPKIEITSYEEGADLEYTMAVELIPEFEPTDLSKIELEKLTVEVEDKQVDEALARMAEQHKKSEPIASPRKSKLGDVLVIDFKGTVDGAEFPGGAAEDHHLELGSNAFIAGFEDQLVGVEPGGHATVNVTFPDAYGNAELAGKEAVFEVDVKEIREPVPVPIDDDLAKLFGIETLEALRQSVRDNIAQEYGTVSRARLKRSLLDALSEAHDFEVPDGMVDLEFETIWKQVESQRKDGEVEAEDAGKSEDELKSEYRAIAVRRVRLGLLLSEIGRRGNVEVDKEDITRAVMAEARQFPGREQEVFEFYQKNAEAMASLRAPLFEDKVIDYIIEQASVSERSVGIDELLAVPQDDETPGAREAPSKPAKTSTKSRTKKAAKSDAAER